MSEQESSNNLSSTVKENAEISTGGAQPVTVHPAMEGLAGLTISKQVGLMLGLAFSVAMGIAVVLWSQEPSYDLLFPSLADQDAAEILEVLNTLDVAYKVDEQTGAILVTKGNTRAIKLKLAAQGLPRSNSLGYELLDKESSFTSSKNVEKMRFQRALEGEIARTIMTIQAIKAAKVILALPKQSVFVRKQKKPSASVIINLYQGRSLEKDQIEAVIHLVASSVPLMEPSQVTVVDQTGRLLNARGVHTGLSLTTKQFEHKKTLEDHLMARIENILMPIVGVDGMRVQISADVDFTVTEKTQELFNPELSVLRSEQTSEDLNNYNPIQGVPGALSNQPPAAGIAPEIVVVEEIDVVDAEQQVITVPAQPVSSSKTATRNFELDKTITHTRLAAGTIRRLSVAVVIDDQYLAAEDGIITRVPFSPEDIKRLTELVKRSVGYDATRGDEVTLSNTTFRAPAEIEALPGEAIWDQTWFISLMKLLAALIVILFLVFGVWRPIMNRLMNKDQGKLKGLDTLLDQNGQPVTVRYDDEGNPVIIRDNEDPTFSLSSETEDLLLLEAPQNYEKRLEYVKKIVDEDPKFVAQVIKSWVTSDG